MNKVYLNKIGHWSIMFFMLFFYAQNSIIGQNVGINTSSPDPSAALDIQSTDSGILIPRMLTSQRTNIVAVEGLLVFDLTTSSFWFMDDSGWVELKSGNVQSLADDDGDTKIQVEETADDDIIRFDMAGTEFFRMDSGRLEILNTGGSVFMGEGAGLNDDLSDNQNTFIGYQAGLATTTGSHNNAIGYETLLSNTTGNKNIANGDQALRFNTTGNMNTAIGYSVLYKNTTGIRNTASGSDALKNNITGISNSAYGSRALFSNTTGSNNTAMGYEALHFNTTANGNTVIGFNAMRSNTLGKQNAVNGARALFNNSIGNNNSAYGYQAGFNSLGDANVYLGNNAGYNETGSNKLYIENSNSTSPLIYGEFDNDLLRINGTLNINDEFSFPTTDGTANQILETDGSGNLTWKNDVIDTLNIITDADNDTKIQIEESADDDIIRFDMAGTEFFRMDSGRLEVLNTGNSVFIGEGAGLNDDRNNNKSVFVGFESGKNNVEGNLNVGIGSKSLKSNSSGNQNTALGTDALQLNKTGDKNIAVGTRSLVLNDSGEGNVGIGLDALHNNTIGSNNVAIGNAAGYHETGSNKLYIENSNSSSPLVYGEFDNDLLRINGTLNINDEFSFPTTDGSANQILETDGSGNLTWETKTINTDTDEQTLSVSGSDLTITGGNTVDLNGVITLITDIDNDTKIQVEETADEDRIRFDIGGTEYFSMVNGRIITSNNGESVFLGRYAGQNDDQTINRNIFIGDFAGRDNVTSAQNVAIGFSSLQKHNSGINNTALGSYSMQFHQSGNDNSVIGGYAMNKNIDGNNNTVLGNDAFRNATTGNENVVIGDEAMINSLEGTGNVAIGKSAGADALGNNNIFLGKNAGKNATGSSVLYIDNSATTTPLIYGEFDNDLLRVNGTLNINDEFSFPTTDGTANQILETDGSGNLTWQDAVTDTLNIIADADNDTKIQVEKTADEDKIRFTLGGTNHFVMNGAMLEVISNGGSVLMGSNAGLNDDLTGNNNTFIGQDAGRASITGFQNICIGSGAGRNTTGSLNTFLGERAGFGNTTGGSNTYVGRRAGYNTTGGHNIFLGHQAGFNVIGSNKLYIENSDSSSPLIYGEFDNNLVRINGDLESTGEVSAASFVLGQGGSTLTKIVKADIPKNVGSISSNGVLNVSFTVSGAETGSSVIVSPSADLPNSVFIGQTRVSEAGTVLVRFYNESNSSKDPANMTYYITVIK